METIIRPRRRRSEKLTKTEFEKFEEWVLAQPTLMDAYLTLGVSEPTLTTVRLKKGQGAPATIAKIRAVIFPNQETA